MRKGLELSTLRQIIRIFFIVLALGLFCYIMSPFVIPVLIGSIFASGLNPIVKFLKAKGIKRTPATLLVMIGFSLVGLLPIGYSISRGGHLLYRYMNNPKYVSFIERVRILLFEILDYLHLNYKMKVDWVKDAIVIKLSAMENFVYAQVQESINQVPSIAFLVMVSVVALYLFLKHGDTIRPKMLAMSTNRAMGEKLMDVLDRCAREIFVTNIITGLLQAIIVAGGAYLFKAGDFFVIFVITFFLSFIPVIGAGPVAFLLAALSFFDHETTSGIGMLVIACVAGVSDNIIRPFLISFGSIKIHPFINFLSTIGGILMFGFAGLFIGPFIVGIFFGAVPILYHELLEDLQKDS